MIDTTSLIDEALARAVAYRTFSLAFQTPTEVRLREMGVFDGFPALIEACACLDAASGRAQPAGCADRLRALAAPDMPALFAQYWRVFGHTTRGLVCACETEYGDDNKFQQPQQLADISGYYLAFGLTPPVASEVRQDHVACECEFMEFLNLKQARLLGLADGDDAAEEALLVTQQAERMFLRDHLAHFGRAFGSSLAVENTGPFYSAVGEAFLRFLDGVCARAGVEGGPASLQVRSDLIDDAPIACGSADELIQIQRRP